MFKPTQYIHKRIICSNKQPLATPQTPVKKKKNTNKTVQVQKHKKQFQTKPSHKDTSNTIKQKPTPKQHKNKNQPPTQSYQSAFKLLKTNHKANTTADTKPRSAQPAIKTALTSSF